MIHEVQGDILLTGAQVIAQGVGANDPMDGGLAKVLRECFPAMHKDFHHWCHVQHPDPGAAWLWRGNERVAVANLVIMEGGYGHGARPGKASVKHLNHALHALKKILLKEKLHSLSLPKIGCGRGGLPWPEVQEMIQHQLGDLDTHIYIYVTHVPRQKAKEPA